MTTDEKTVVVDKSLLRRLALELVNAGGMTHREKNEVLLRVVAELLALAENVSDGVPF